MSMARSCSFVLPLLVLVACGSGSGSGHSGLGTGADHPDSGVATGTVPDLAHCTVTADRTDGVLANGSDAVTLTALVRDANDRPVPGVVVTFQSGTVGVSIGVPAATDATGTTTATVTSTVAAQVTITASLPSGAFPSPVSVRFVNSPSRLLFWVQPSDSTLNTSLPEVQVEVVDAAGQRVAGAAVPVQLGWAVNPSGATLNGTLNVTSADGVAHFGDLSVNALGSGYALRATSPGLQGATSSAFQVTATATDVTGTWINHADLVDGGEVLQPIDLSQAPIAALVPESDGGYTVYPGSGTDAGLFAISGVPDAGYVLQVSGNFYGPTTGRSWDLGMTAWGRADAIRASAGTTLSATLSNMASWQSADELEAWSPTVQSTGSFRTFGLDAGTTSATLVLNAAGTVGNRLVQASKGDYGYITQLTSTSMALALADGGTSSVQVGALNRALRFSDVEMVAGADATTSGVLTPLTQDQSLSVSIDFPAFAGLLPPSFAPGYFDNAFDILGGLGSGNEHSNAAVDFAAPPETLASQSFTFTYATLPEDRDFRVEHLLVSYLDIVAMNGTSYRRSADAVQWAPLSNLSSTLEPQLGPVPNVRINGQDILHQTVSGAGLSPTISWDAPLVGTPTVYSVVIAGMYPATDVPALWWTTGTSFVVPPGLLTNGETYRMSVEAWQGPSVSLHHPDTLSAQVASSGMGTSLFSP